jgi:hypothetical protein
LNIKINIKVFFIYVFIILSIYYSSTIYAKNIIADFDYFYKFPVSAPDTVTNKMVRLVSSSEALVSFIAPINNGGSDIISYTVSSNPGSISVTNASSPILLTGLTPGITYAFSIVATNASGNSLATITPSLTMGGYWDLNGNTGSNSSNFIGTTDAQALSFKTNNISRMLIGSDGAIDFKNNTLHGFKASVQDKTASYTLNISDNGKLITFNANSIVILNIPTGLPIGFNVNILQKGTGKIDFQAVSGVILNNRGGFHTTTGLYAAASLISYANNVFVLSGDLE